MTNSPTSRDKKLAAHVFLRDCSWQQRFLCEQTDFLATGIAGICKESGVSLTVGMKCLFMRGKWKQVASRNNMISETTLWRGEIGPSLSNSWRNQLGILYRPMRIPCSRSVGGTLQTRICWMDFRFILLGFVGALFQLWDHFVQLSSWVEGCQRYLLLFLRRLVLQRV